MSKITIQNFNYFESGTKSKMFSLDLKAENGQIEKNIVFFGSTEKNNDIMQIDDKYNKFSTKIDNSDLIIHPLYDIKDSCLKTTLKYKNNNHLDIYSPEIKENPIEFTQLKDVSYVLNTLDNQSIVSYETTLKSQRSQNSNTIIDNIYQFTLANHNKDTFIYGNNTKNELTDSFDIEYNLQNIKYNSLIEIPQSSEFHNYEEGDIYGDLIFSKNSFNNIYSMEMSSLTSLINSRTYCGINKCSNQIYLKYYDNIDYEGSYSSETDNIKNISMTQTQKKEYPYQKIETLGYVNKFNYKSYHKSNLFSIQINGLELSSSQSIPYIDQIKTNIKNVIRQIVKDTCPINTQLFDVYFQ